jgi:hypothetical protein
MSILGRKLMASLLLCGLAPWAYCASISVSKDVVALRETVIALTGESDLKSAIDSFAIMQVRLIGAKDPTWGKDNANWSPVWNVIRDDLNRDVGILLVAQLRDISERWDHALSTQLTPSQSDELVKFYRSVVGQRYIGFQKRLRTIQEEAASAVPVNLITGATDRAPGAPATVAQVEIRKHVAALSWVNLIIPALASPATPDPGANLNAEKILNDMLADALAKVRGPELDQIGAAYSKDLDAFAAFQASPAAKALISVYGFVAKDLQSDPTAPGTAFAAALQRSVELHTPEWKAAFEAGRASAH